MRTFVRMKRHVKIIATLMMVCATHCVAQTSLYNEPYETYGLEKSMPVFFPQLKEELKAAQDSMERRGITRADVLATMQTAPPAPDDYGYEVIASEQREGYTAQKIAFNVNKWERVLAYLLVPDSLTASPYTSLTPNPSPKGEGNFWRGEELRETSRKETHKKSRKQEQLTAPSPSRGGRGEGLPAILLLHDHGAHFTIGKEKMVRPFGVDSLTLADAEAWTTACYDGNYVGDELAKHGYVVLCTDALFWGDRAPKRLTEAERGSDLRQVNRALYERQQALAANMMQMGTSWGAWMTWDDIRTAAFLAHLPMVDKERIGCLGHSMGAYRSWMLAALSDDIKASASVCWMNDTEHLMTLDNNQNRGGSAFAMLIPGIRNVADYPQTASLAAPKPALFFNGTRDKLFPVEGVKASYEIMRKAWADRQAEDRLVTRLWDEKHYFNKDMQKEVLEFFNRSLSPNPKPYP